MLLSRRSGNPITSSGSWEQQELAPLASIKVKNQPTMHGACLESSRRRNGIGRVLEWMGPPLQAVAQVLVFAAAGWRGGFRAGLSGDGRSETGATQKWPWSADCQKKIARRLAPGHSQGRHASIKCSVSFRLRFRDPRKLHRRCSGTGGSCPTTMRRAGRRFQVDCNELEV